MRCPEIGEIVTVSIDGCDTEVVCRQRPPLMYCSLCALAVTKNCKQHNLACSSWERREEVYYAPKNDFQSLLDSEETELE
jgi:hypothetical protein